MSDSLFDKLANKAASDVKEPMVVPEGVYKFVITSGSLNPPRKKTENGPIAKALFGLRILEVVEVDEVDLEGVEQEDLESARLMYEIPVFKAEEDYRITDFVGRIVGVENLDEMSLKEACKAAKGYEISGTVVHRDNPDNEERPFSDVKYPSRIED